MPTYTSVSPAIRRRRKRISDEQAQRAGVNAERQSMLAAGKPVQIAGKQGTYVMQRGAGGTSVRPDFAPNAAAAVFDLRPKPAPITKAVTQQARHTPAAMAQQTNQGTQGFKGTTQGYKGTPGVTPLGNKRQQLGGQWNRPGDIVSDYYRREEVRSGGGRAPNGQQPGRNWFRNLGRPNQQGQFGEWQRRVPANVLNQPIGPARDARGNLRDPNEAVIYRRAGGEQQLMQPRDPWNRNPVAEHPAVGAVREEMARGVRGLTNAEKAAGMQGPVQTRYGQAIERALERAGIGAQPGAGGKGAGAAGKVQPYTPFDLTPEQQYYAEDFSKRFEDAIKGNDWSEVWRLNEQREKMGVPTEVLSPTSRRFVDKLGRFQPGRLPEEVEAEQKTQQEQTAEGIKYTKFVQGQVDRARSIADKTAESLIAAERWPDLEQMEKEWGEKYPDVPMPPNLETWGKQQMQKRQKWQQETWEKQKGAESGRFAEFVKRGNELMEGATTPGLRDAAFEEINRLAEAESIPQETVETIDGYSIMRLAKKKGLPLEKEKEMSSDERKTARPVAEAILAGRTIKEKETGITVEVGKPAVKAFTFEEYEPDGTKRALMSKVDYLDKLFHGEKDDTGVYQGLWKAWKEFEAQMGNRKIKSQAAAPLWLDVLFGLGPDVMESWQKNLRSKKAEPVDWEATQAKFAGRVKAMKDAQEKARSGRPSISAPTAPPTPPPTSRAPSGLEASSADELGKASEDARRADDREKMRAIRDEILRRRGKASEDIRGAASRGKMQISILRK